MNTLILFVVEIALSLTISLALVTLIKPLLRNVLVETCGTDKRADFWSMFTQLMLIISPLLLVIYFIPTEPNITPNVAESLKETLFRALLGDFIALACIGNVIWKTVKLTPATLTSDNPQISEAVQ